MDDSMMMMIPFLFSVFFVSVVCVCLTVDFFREMESRKYRKSAISYQIPQTGIDIIPVQQQYHMIIYTDTYIYMYK